MIASFAAAGPGPVMQVQAVDVHLTSFIRSLWELVSPMGREIASTAFGPLVP